MSIKSKKDLYFFLLLLFNKKPLRYTAKYHLLCTWKMLTFFFFILCVPRVSDKVKNVPNRMSFTLFLSVEICLRRNNIEDAHTWWYRNKIFSRFQTHEFDHVYFTWISIHLFFLAKIDCVTAANINQFRVAVNEKGSSFFVSCSSTADTCSLFFFFGKMNKI